VHLKSGCFDQAHSGSACSTLFEQVPVLETWIDQPAGEDVPFIVLGDFNRRFNLPGEPIWAELDDGRAMAGRRAAGELSRAGSWVQGPERAMDDAAGPITTDPGQRLCTPGALTYCSWPDSITSGSIDEP
jgi:hypothetical protein